LFNELAPETPEEIQAALRAAGYAPEHVAAHMQAVADRTIAHSPFNWRHRARQEMAEESARRAALEPVLPRSRGDLLQAIRQLLTQIQGSAVELAAHFRNFDRATDEDLVSLLADLEYLATQQRKQGEQRKD
jgi:hypothetical protein